MILHIRYTVGCICITRVRVHGCASTILLIQNIREASDRYLLLTVTKTAVLCLITTRPGWMSCAEKMHSRCLRRRVEDSAVVSFGKILLRITWQLSGYGEYKAQNANLFLLMYSALFRIRYRLIDWAGRKRTSVWDDPNSLITVRE